MSKLILLVDSFPYGTGESFLESELKYCDMDVFIFPYDSDYKDVRSLSENRIRVFPRLKNKKNKFYRYFKYFSSLLCLDMLEELLNMVKKNELHFQTIKKALYFRQDSIEYYRWVASILDNIEDDFIFYSYWMYIQAYAGIKLKIRYNSKCITRCHGFDIYKERHDYNYIPFRHFIFSNINNIYTVSVQAKEYLINENKILNDKVRVARLGSHMECNYACKKRKSKSFHILTCSSIVSVKRLDLLINTLQEINEIEIHYTHIGSGPLYNEFAKMAKNKLGKNIKTNLVGYMNNNDVLDYYKKNEVDLFINVSSSEGAPVSIMEASSFGIPIIATDVGGVKEMVLNGINGFLISKDFTSKDLKTAIISIYNMQDNLYQNLSMNSRKIWEDKFNAKSNYTKFYKGLRNIKDENNE